MVFQLVRARVRQGYIVGWLTSTRCDIATSTRPPTGLDRAAIAERDELT